ncbi:bifunctional diaminohydroxyphosphoribosylaminopyrimidine deaminase/5-amino-6-(5-phosphoribosylamino)uracil reductase RibD [Rhodococcus coprophilus]|uniref:Riboflavin biosynthesis protein RibD n=1 Tax=Rhodococcus coprophilus TaxID=38310 RepID=A0A2X4U817_9NOCA|nr:bifunctional diaminohydroxyphosphoribosylaminopyrimidine deaminase/5-amino-6-(5-phosphoribosylamino)uracil reductase RibD [Rhodococcus coprophilus]MBM7461068.1 diaminohydroxyphosphoribosylaminopyrimidine deaminase/5-amino-6-(5-phosphoribosylamino)uracil reductase [Rhodococcus coprophilus]SQI28870.1 diaminohydroxyphosphoribosylaminopyrimidine deaminase/5-amino-6-(5-phosphoribosylamino)uracil reductase ribg [Rhodococcus coprophilus]
MTPPEVLEAFQFALDASEAVRGTTSPNPPVGAVILDASGQVAGVGATAPPGGPHAEVRALAAAGDRARGGTAVVTLEPCNHTGRTGPCARALVDAGIASVYYSVSDPNPIAGGGADTLRAAGVTVHPGLGADAVIHGPLRAWLHRARTGRPHVTWKYAATLDGRSAAQDGTSQWISGPESRARVHDERSRLDAIVVGTGTVLTDDPWLTARLPDGQLAPHQPLRVVVGLREIPTSARVLDDAAPTLVLRTRDIGEVLDALTDHPDVLIEGGPRLAGAFLAARSVDRVQAYLAPVVLGAGTTAVQDAGVHTVTEALRFRRERVETVGADVLLTLVPDRDQ